MIISYEQLCKFLDESGLDNQDTKASEALCIKFVDGLVQIKKSDQLELANGDTLLIDYDNEDNIVSIEFA